MSETTKETEKQLEFGHVVDSKPMRFFIACNWPPDEASGIIAENKKYIMDLGTAKMLRWLAVQCLARLDTKDYEDILEEATEEQYELEEVL